MARFQTLHDPQLIAMHAAATRFLVDIATGAPPRWLALFGSSGAGKTFLSDLIYDAVGAFDLLPNRVIEMPGDNIPINGRMRVRWELMLKSVLDRKQWGRIGDLCLCRLALIDEIAGDLMPQDIATPKLVEVCERRLGKWTIFTSNKNLNEIKRRDARIASRMIRGGSEVVDVDVVDFNLR